MDDYGSWPIVLHHHHHPCRVPAGAEGLTCWVVDLEHPMVGVSHDVGAGRRAHPALAHLVRGVEHISTVRDLDIDSGELHIALLAPRRSGLTGTIDAGAGGPVQRHMLLRLSVRMAL